MKRFLLMLVICVSSFMIYTNNVKAENSYAQITLHNVTYSTFNGNYANVGNYNALNYVNFTPNNANSFLTFNFESRIIPQYSNYFLFPFSMYVDNDKSLTCNNEYVAGNILQDINFSTTYADGSQAQNSGTIESSSNIYRYCQSYSYYENTTGIIVSYISNNHATEFYCNVFSGGNDYVALCPITQNQSNGSTNFDRIRIHFSDNSSNNITFHIKYGGQVNFNIDNTYTILNKLTSIENKLNELKSNSSAIVNNTNEIKNDIKSDNTRGAEGSADTLKNNSAFQDNSGLSSVISMPLTFVNSLTNTCQPINLNIPYMDVEVIIPCMQPIITNKMPLLANLIKIVVNGFIVYRILLDIFQIVRNAKNPEDDRIEVLDL